MIWQRDHHVRRIYLNQGSHRQSNRPGSANPSAITRATRWWSTLSPLEHPRSYVDNYRTPHTKDLHVWSAGNGPDARWLEAELHRRRSGTFTKPGRDACAGSASIADR